jgi:hypothetical protein
LTWPLSNSAEGLFLSVKETQMNDRVVTPDLCIEIHRYSKPEDIFRFYFLTALNEHTAQDAQGFDRIKHYPFRRIDWRESRILGPAYVEVKREQVPAWGEKAKENWEYLPKTFKAYSLQEIGPDMAHWLVHTHCPIEWHRILDDPDHPDHAKVSGWVKVWVREELEGLS